MSTLLLDPDDDPRTGQEARDTHHPPAGADLLPAASRPTTPKVASPQGPSGSTGHVRIGTPAPDAGAADSLLLIYADSLDDLERVRIATENRVRSLVHVKEMEGPEVARLSGLCEGLRALEHGAELELKRALRTHPLGPWVKRTTGIGEKQGARLLAAIGDPYWNTLHDRPRTVSELWAYCGYHVLPAGQRSGDAHTRCVGGDPSSNPGHGSSGAHTTPAGVAPSRKRGERANWNATAKMRAFLVAESCIKHRTSPYRVVYDDTRAKYADAIHNVDCRRCGPAGKPALAGSPLSDGHKHARALRAVAKAVLRDLWIEARRLHEGDAQ